MRKGIPAVSGERFESEFKEIMGLVERHDSVLVMGHIDPDGDCIGSMLSLSLMLRAKGKKVSCYAPGEMPGQYSRLPGFDMMTTEQEARTVDFDLVIAVDCPTTGRTENIVRPCLGQDIVNIDHHPTNERYGCVNVVDEGAASTTMLIYRLLSSRTPEMITPEIAGCLYLGILMDTGGFRFQNTDADALHAAGELVSLGADAYGLTHEFLYMKEFRSLKLLGLVLDSLDLHLGGRAATMCVTGDMLERTGTELKDSEGFVDYAAALDDVELIALLREEGPARTRVSLRSRNGHDVSALAERFGGGGHVRAAGLVLERGVDESLQLILEGFAELIGG